MGAKTVEKYKKYIGKDAALEKRFQPVDIGEPITILFGIQIHASPSN